MTSHPHDTSGADAQETTYLIHPEVSSKINRHHIDAILEELAGLARAISLEVLDTKTINVGRIQAGSFLGKGQREAIKADIDRLKPDVVIFNYTLSPIQQRNLEREWKVKVIDRTGLILEIFGERAETREGRLQVDLAALEYQRSRLVRSWTHLERQRGGAGFMGGPGETQIEIDRRLIAQRITKLKKELQDVRRTRDLGRQSRERVPFPIIALVGYTNAGKSTLFNTLTSSGVFAEDLPFATLDPKLKRLELPNGQTAILSDTVGFISELPTHLIAAFRATLEQILYADVIVHVIDCSKDDYEAQKQDVIDVLTDLGIEYKDDERVLELYNKIDMLDEEDIQDITREASFKNKGVPISALKGTGLEEFLQRATEIIARKRVEVSFDLNITDGKALSWLYSHAEILERKDLEEGIHIRVMIDPPDLNRFKDQFKYEAA